MALQNNWLTITHIRYKFTQFWKEMEKFEQHRKFLSDTHQNLMSSELYQGATEYKNSSIFVHLFLKYSVHKILKTYILTDWPTEIFKKWSNFVQDISKYVNSSKTGYRKFSGIWYLLLMIIDKSKKEKKQKEKQACDSIFEGFSNFV